MNQADAHAWLTARLRPDVDPTLTTIEVADLVASARVEDVDGNAVGSEEWVPTYGIRNLHIALVDGWRMKAAEASMRFDFTTDGQQFRRSQVADACERQADMWRRRIAGSVTMKDWRAD